MTGWAPAAVYLLCLVTSALCAALLFRAWRANRTKLLLYTAIGFGFLALNNFFLVADMLLFPDAYLLPWRVAANMAAVGVLVYGFTFEVES
jgi:hypothetical protein